MTMATATDILIREAPDRDRFRIALSRAFGIAPGLVTVTEADGLDPIPNDVQVLLLRQPLTMPGDFPEWYHLSIETSLVERIDPAFDTVARELGMAILTDAEDYFSMTLHLPDGTRHTVELSQDDDDTFMITPEIQRLIDGAARHAIAS